MADIAITPTYPTLPAPQQVTVNDKPFPLVFSVEEAAAASASQGSPLSKEQALAWLRSKREWVDGELLPAHGAILFRGFPLEEAADFYDFINVFDWSFKERYLGGGGPRITILGPIKTSTETPKEFTIPFHHELIYVTERPSKLIFFCKTPPDTQGQTPLLFSNAVVRKAEEKNPEFVARLKEKKVRYIRTLSDRSTSDFKYQACWQDIYDTEVREEAEQRARDTGTETIDWLDSGDMKVTTRPMEAVAIEERTGLPVWYNAVCLLHPAAHGKEGAAAPWTVVYGDHTPIADEDVKGVVAEMRALGVFPTWQRGDVMLVDNRLAMHAREPFTGPRKILAAMIHE
eukprot:TRINITY_DN3335_c0_g1_i1.p1 TRINITY_DN3335_c0_g1~~TRINITY_DN3335_c0_g1_i1.p1  ORF type:complete len:374 (+),score=111.37 TRINITY_DN3335_c0_g1_i1:91-1122(+)